MRLVGRFAYRLPAALAAACLAQAAFGCSFDPISEEEQREQNREAVRASKSVTQGRDCSFVNGGIYDNFSGGPAISVGEDRFYQVLRTEAGQVVDALVVDCGERAATRVISDFIKNENYVEGSCGGDQGDRFALLAPAGPLTLTEGRTLEDFEQIANETGKVLVDGSLEALRMDTLGKKLPKRDQVNFFCGCKLFYPDLAEASQ